ncbi:MAG: HlyD family efflux transporter periplasmic adaptor subunit [Planctomycetia bacterium]|nr:HlyD family efflux transporter periplasmic adaptor subunit [Planctomycetia bacterium]
MAKRLILFAAVALLLVAALVYSQWRTEPLKVSGFIESDEIRVGSRVGGRVAKVTVEEGDEVKQGTVLLELEPFDLLDQLAQAKADRDARAADLGRLNRGFRDEEKAQAKAKLDQLSARAELLETGPREEDKKAAEAKLRLAQAQRDLARMRFDRIKKLFDDGLTTQESFDQAETERRVAEETVVVRELELAILKEGTRDEEKREAAAQKEEAYQAWLLRQNGYRDEEKEQAKAALAAAGAAVGVFEKRLGELKLIAPSDCTVESIDLEPGDLVSAGAPVISLADKRRLWIRAYVPESRLAVQVGQKVSLTVDSFPGETYVGRISFIARQGEFRPGNVQTPEERSKQVFRIKVDLETGLDKLRPGMVADVWLDRPAQ